MQVPACLHSYLPASMKHASMHADMHPCMLTYIHVSPMHAWFWLFTASSLTVKVLPPGLNAALGIMILHETNWDTLEIWWNLQEETTELGKSEVDKEFQEETRFQCSTIIGIIGFGGGNASLQVAHPPAGWALLAHAGYFTCCLYLPCLLSYDLSLKDETTLKGGMHKWTTYGESMTYYYVTYPGHILDACAIGMMHEWPTYNIPWCDATWELCATKSDMILVAFTYLSVLFFQHDTIY